MNMNLNEIVKKIKVTLKLSKCQIIKFLLLLLYVHNLNVHHMHTHTSIRMHSYHTCTNVTIECVFKNNIDFSIFSDFCLLNKN